jgi:uncharacterized membrane protein YraQ (UPF0718 family)
VNKSLLIMGGLALLATATAYHKSPALAWEGASASVRTFLNVLPAMVIGFLLGGMVQVLLPQHLVAAYAGAESGLGGLVIGGIAGAFTPGGPFVAFPIVASLWKAGTGIGPLVAFLTAWSLLGFHRILIYEGPIMGWRFVTVRILSAILAPLVVGYLATWFHRLLSGGRG